MIEQFPAFLGEEIVGTVDLRTNGLYYDIQAKCRLSGQVVCRLVASAGAQTVNLGILVPENDSFCISARIARRKLDEGELTFRVCPKNQPTEYPVIILRPEEPFRYLDRLTRGYLRIEGDQMYFTDPAAD